MQLVDTRDLRLTAITNAIGIPTNLQLLLQSIAFNYVESKFGGGTDIQGVIKRLGNFIVETGAQVCYKMENNDTSVHEWLSCGNTALFNSVDIVATESNKMFEKSFSKVEQELLKDIGDNLQG